MSEPSGPYFFLLPRCSSPPTDPVFWDGWEALLFCF